VASANGAADSIIRRSGLRLKAIDEGELARALLEGAMNITSRDEGYVYVDRAFNVKGVGPVVLGYTKTRVYVHDRLYALPSMRQVEVRSIEVLDEEQDSVGPGVRVGFAVKGAEVEELKESYALVTEPSRVAQRLSVRAVIYPWSDVPQSGGVSLLIIDS
jgi:selenocysteine-specific translation elongation factor